MLARRGLGAGLLLAALGGACAEERAAPVRAVVADAGPACEPGAQGCACNGGSGCQAGLLCSARRCLPTEGPRELEPALAPRPPLPRPAAPAPAPPAAPDAGPADAGLADAALSDASP